MFETLKNPFIFAAAIWGGLAVFALICKCIMTICRIIFIKPGEKEDSVYHYSDSQLREKNSFEKSRYQ
jgi:hypothetical protein